MFILGIIIDELIDIITEITSNNAEAPNRCPNIDLVDDTKTSFPF